MHRDRAGYPLETAPRGWRTDRVPVLAYGSNACPSKITWLRETFGLAGDVVVARAECTGLSAVWAAGLRGRDARRPATIAAAPGVVEHHAVWFATADQLRVLDVCEGRGERYHLARLHTGAVTLDDGTPVADPLAYVGAAPERLPLLVEGHPVRTAALAQREAITLRGEPAASHGLSVTVL